MYSGTGDRGLDRNSLSVLVCEMHPIEEKHFIIRVESSKSVPSHRTIPSSPYVRCHLQGVWSSSHGLGCY